MIDAEHVTFPVAYGLDAKQIAQTLGSFYQDNPDGAFLHPADFIIRPDGAIDSATYSTAAVGRLRAEDALAQITFRKKMARASWGRS